MTEREQLFRPEVLSQQPDRSFGTPVLQRHYLSGLLVSLCVVLVSAVLLLLAITQYRETETTRGVLVPSGGSHRVVAPVTATVQQIAVQVGATVHQGQVLATLERATFDQYGTNAAQAEVTQWQVQRELLQQEQALQAQQYAARQQQAAAMLAELQASKKLIEVEQALLQQQLQLSESQQQSLGKLAQARAISRAQLEQGQLEHLEFQLRAQAVAQRRQADLAQTDTHMAQAENERMQYRQLQLQMEQKLQQLQWAFTQGRNQVHLTVVAAAAGVVATVAIAPGQSVQALQPLFYIDTEPAQLQATLYVSSRVLGKLYPGQTLLLSYDAFDFQHFGRYQATIDGIDHASLDPREHLLPVPGIQEPVFRITAQLTQGWVEGADVFRLQSGMLFSADIVLEEMSLLAFIFKPVLRLRARMA